MGGKGVTHEQVIRWNIKNVVPCANVKDSGQSATDGVKDKKNTQVLSQHLLTKPLKLLVLFIFLEWIYEFMELDLLKFYCKLSR